MIFFIQSKYRLPPQVDSPYWLLTNLVFEAFVQDQASNQLKFINKKY